MEKLNIYDTIQHLPLSKVAEIQAYQDSCQEIEDSDIIECKLISTIPASYPIYQDETPTIPAPTQDLFTRLTADLSIPPIGTKCKECKEYYYIDHDLIYCNVCHYPILFCPVETKTEGKKMDDRYPGVGFLIVVFGSLLLWAGIIYGMSFLFKVFQ